MGRLNTAMMSVTYSYSRSGVPKFGAPARLCKRRHIVFTFIHIIHSIHLNSPEWLGNSDMIEVRTH